MRDISLVATPRDTDPLRPSPPLYTQAHADADDREVQGCVQCLQSFARIGGEGLDAWPAPGTEGANARAVCASVVALLEGPRSDSACLFVGPLVSTMLLRMPSLMAPCVARVVESVLRRLGRCEMPLPTTCSSCKLASTRQK